MVIENVMFLEKECAKFTVPSERQYQIQVRSKLIALCRQKILKPKGIYVDRGLIII